MEEKTVSELLDNAVLVVKGRVPAVTTDSLLPKITQAAVNIAQAKRINDSLNEVPLGFDKETRFVISRLRTNLSPVDMMNVTQAIVNIMNANVASACKDTKPKAARTKVA